MDKTLSDIPEKEIKKYHKVIGKHIKLLRENKKISQLDMALAIGIKSIAFYSNCENNKYDKHFNMEHLYKICKALGIQMSDFFKEVEQGFNS